ncbi:MAG: glycosidase, partial [Bacteroidia bacterium]|nr:glycosidase [Bacteroidia bacterium]
MRKILGIFISLIFISGAFAQDDIKVVENNGEWTLQVNGEEFMINGMNWDYFPIGTTNPNYNFWGQSDDFIKAALDHEMLMLKNMGVNVIRQYVGVTPRWVKYIYENYGIYTMINHTFGRYGLTLDGAWVPNTDYDDPRVRELLITETKAMVDDFKGTPGLLLYMLGNENNYGLFWDGAETEDIPIDQRRSTQRAYPMYKLFNDAAIEMKKIDPDLPVSICNGDLLFLDIIAETCKDIDIYGTNVYRGKSFGNLFDEVKEKFNKPVLFAEFGSDAFNALTNKEAQKDQAFYMVENWREIYQNAAGLGKTGNSIGGFTFQFSDGWWKYAQDKNLDVHDNTASWANGGYRFDFVEGQNNMNEEWFGVCAKGPTDNKGLYKLFPRAAYYALKEAHAMNPYDEGIDLDFVNNYFDDIELMDAVLRARGDKAALGGNETSKVRISQLRAEFTTFNTGGKLITTPEDSDPDEELYPDELGFDHMQSYYFGVEGNPTSNMRANVNVNVLGNVAENPIDELFYENRGRTVAGIFEEAGRRDPNENNRVRIYNAEFEWKAKEFDLRGFYRTGHYHWGYEGDFFGLYREANYGPNLDIYSGEILGIEVDGKKFLKGLKIAFGPQLWWGANPAVLLKYDTKLGDFDFSAIFHEDVDDASAAQSSIAFPVPRTRRLTVYGKTKLGDVGLEIGGIWGGQPLNGRTFQVVEGEPGNYTIYEDEIDRQDNWGGKIKLTYQKGPFNWYAQAAAMGLVAGGGADETRTYTGWRLKDSGSGNQTNFLTGFTYLIGDFQIAPNFLWQKPLIDPIPNDVQTPGRLRNIIDDPFVVRSNRETTAGEILITYDPTPASWYYEWDNDRQEDAKFAFNLGFVYRHHPTSMDAAIGFLADRTSFAFPNAVPAEDLWELNSRIVSKITPDFGVIGNLYYGNGQANGSDERLITRGGGDVRLIYKNIKVINSLKFNDWGPFDYHRDFNLTFPVQAMIDISTTVGKPDWFILPDTR